jgi:SAM-dependent methyltransferase
MKLCTACGSSYASSLASCQQCGFVPVIANGFTAYAPESAYESEGFKPEYFEELARLEAGNFWFVSRSRLILWLLKKYCGEFGSLLEIGCGTGYVLSGISEEFDAASLYGSELLLEGLPFAAARVPSATFMQMDARRIPFIGEYDVIGAFDVLEHIADDERVLAQVYAALKPGGTLILTVPQHPWLWSSADEYACHVRRYRAGELERKLVAADFEVTRSTSFLFSLLPLMLVSRLVKGKTLDEDYDATTEFSLAPWLNRLLTGVLVVEYWITRIGINLPAGGSRVVVARKPGVG